MKRIILCACVWLIVSVLITGSLTKSYSAGIAGAAPAQISVQQGIKREPADGQLATGASTISQMCSEGSQLFRNRVYFDGNCRSVDFFRRFLSKGAKLVGVAGPRTAASDTGVIVIETPDEQEVSELMILPEKRKAGFTLSKGYQYRADYPVVAIRTYRTWKDPQGFVNQIAELKGPTTAYRTAGPQSIPTKITIFSTVAWVHRIQTVSGWQQFSSDGTHSVSTASGGSGTYCSTAASGVDLAATGLCTGAAAGLSIG
jgi:hypothetical protein